MISKFREKNKKKKEMQDILLSEVGSKENHRKKRMLNFEICIVLLLYFNMQVIIVYLDFFERSSPKFAKYPSHDPHFSFEYPLLLSLFLKFLCVTYSTASFTSLGSADEPSFCDFLYSLYQP